MSFWIINPTFRKPWIISRGLVIFAIFSLDYKLWIINLRIVKFCGHNRLQVDFCLGCDFSGLYNFFWIINPWIIIFFWIIDA